MTVTDFLLACIAEDEAVAQEAVESRRRPRATDGRSAWQVSASGMGVLDGGASPSVARGAQGVMAHIARHDPARVLAECEAKRVIVNAWVLGADLGIAVRALAQVYRDRPGWQEEWTL